MNEPATEPKSPDPEIISYLHMRKFVGWLALALPVLTSAGYMLLGVEHWQVLDSISEYYYTFMRDVFVGTLCMVGLFLYAYKGYNSWENKVFNFAALLCVFIAFYGMDPKGYTGNFPHMFNGHILIAHHGYFEYIHLGCASILFVTLGYVSNCLFTKSDETENPQLGKKRTHKKIQRNAIYHVCGWLIWISLLAYV
ncbi:MAG TPA: hypothetical protein VK808_01125, partial [Bacteroidia bacterium]|nr:hypothetical protein [Bacteroidia bacterium]